MALSLITNKFLDTVKILDEFQKEEFKMSQIFFILYSFKSG